MLPFVLNNSRYFSHSDPAVCLLLQGATRHLLTTGGRASLCFKGREITVRGVNDIFFSNVSLILLEEIIASTSPLRSAVRTLWMSKRFKGSVAILDPLL